MALNCIRRICHADVGQMFFRLEKNEDTCLHNDFSSFSFENNCSVSLTRFIAVSIFVSVCAFCIFAYSIPFSAFSFRAFYLFSLYLFIFYSRPVSIIIYKAIHWFSSFVALIDDTTTLGWHGGA